MTIRTVLGDIPSESLGATNYHEHLFQTSILLPGDDLDDEAASLAEANSLRNSGFAAMVDATPIGLGRRPEALARISETLGLGIVATTGRHKDTHYQVDHWLRAISVEALGQRFIADLVDGMRISDGAEGASPASTPAGEPVRAGVLKAAIDYWSISAFERDTLSAVARAHRETGAPVMVHLEFGTAAHEVLDLLAADGVPESAITLAHADRNPDAGLHVSLAERGAYLGYDGMARPRGRTDEELLVLIERVVDHSSEHRILLGGDVARSSRYVAYGGMPGLEYLGLRFLPRLIECIGQSAVERMLVGNTARWLSWQ